MTKRRSGDVSQRREASAASDEPVESSSGAQVGLKNSLSRRAFLVRSSLVAGAAAAIGSVPNLGSLLSTSEAESSDIGGAASEAATSVEAGSTASEPLVAHVINASTGEINLYQGTNQIVTRSPGLAQAIARLAASKS
ncbi:MAG TPA: twin-arginine translocation signal domain-containing protein [Acidimicrobiales bacterium]|nr:twin-arginine translocation signal domain-containing protein [Acidimicrobiales bacterium]